MRVNWLPGWIKWGGAVAVVGVLVGLAISRPGFPEAAAELNDQSVWVTNSAQMKVGRYNQPIEELTGGLRATSAGFDVLQQAQQVALGEVGTVRLIDPATVTAGEGSRADDQAVFTLGGGVVLTVDGAGSRAWLRRFDQAATLRTNQDKASFELGSGGVATVATDGTVYAAKDDGTLLKAVLAGDSVKVSTLGHLPVAGGQLSAITAVGPNVYALAGTTLLWDAGSVDLSEYGPDLLLQAPSDPAETVGLAGSTALLEVDQTGHVAQHATGSNGQAAAPVRVAGCLYGAWASRGDNFLRVCPRAGVKTRALEQVNAASKLVFRVNRDLVVLNDVADGRLWLPQRDAQVREPNWNEIEPDSLDQRQTKQHKTDLEHQTDCTKEQSSPVAKADHFGVRADSTTVLMVLGNDSAGDCGALGIKEITGLPPGLGQATLVHQGRAIQLQTKAQAAGSYSFSYTVLDGRKDTVASTATVTIEVVPAGQNRAPVQDRPSALVMEQGSQTTHQVLADFSDPDGDPIYLAGVSSAAGLEVKHQANGLLALSGGDQLGVWPLEVKVSDGNAATSGTVSVDLRPPGQVEPQLDPIMVQGFAGQEVLVPVRDSVRSGHVEPVQVAAINAPADASAQVDPDKGQVIIKAAVAKTYYFDVTVAAGVKTGRGVIRFDAQDLPDPAPPVAVLDTAYLSGSRTATIDPLANDQAPAGGEMIVTDVKVPPDLGVKVAVVDHQFLQIIPAGAGPVSGWFNYTMAVDGKTAAGRVEVVRAPDAPGQPPVLAPVAVTVKAGGVVTIPVLETASHPDGEPITIKADFDPGLKPGQGRAYVGANSIRYQAPDKAMTVEIPYQVQDPSGAVATGVAQVRVHQSQGATKPRPTPADLSGRVFAGETTRVSVPLTGIDVDGDGVLLQGLDSVPLKGRIIEVGADFFWYEAFPGEVGTDAFTYAVEDWVGLRAVAQIKVAVAERPTGLGGVVARDDDLLVRPGEQLQARVLANDLDMAGGSLSLCGQPVGSAPGLKPSYAGSRLVVDAPAKAGTVQFEYTACNSRGDQDRATLRVRVDPKAPIQAPRAGDVVVSPADSINRSSVDIDVMALADNPSGPLSDLEVSLPPAGQDLAVVTSQSKLRVKLQNEPTIVFYQLTNRRPEAGGSHAFGYVSVPALGTFPPVLRPGEDAITVIAGQPTELALARYVMVGPGKRAYLAQPDAIGAAKSDGSRPYLDNQTLLYSAASNYAGPASITFKVADSADLTSAETRLAVLTLPITVKPAGQVRPAFTPPSLEVERAGVPKAVDLTNFVTVLGAPVPPGTLTTKLSGWTGGGIDVSLNGTVLTVSAANDVPTGWRGAIGLMIGYETSPPIRVSVEVQVTAPTRRLTALVRLPRQVLSQGQAQMVEVLAGAWNPAPEIGGLTLRQVSVNPPGAGSAAIVGSSVQVTPADGFLGEMSINFTVNDALAEPNREVTGSFAATVRGRPNAPGPPRAGLPADGQVPLVFDPPKDNGAAIIDYRVSWGSGSQLCFQSSCTITSLTNGQTYSFAVQARNEVGLSAQSAYSPAVLVDLVPLAPRNLAVQRGNQKLTVSWAAPPKHGSAVTKYLVTLTGGAVVSVETAATTYVFTDLEAGREYNLAVRAQNNHPEPSPPAQGTAVPFGDPDRPTITVTRLDASTLSAAVPPVQGHGSPPEYRVRYRAGGGRTQAICGSGGAITACNIPTQPGVTYEVWAEVKNETDNWIASASQMVTQYSRPVISQVKLSPGAGLGDQDGGHIDVVFSGSAQPNSLIFTISLSNGSSQTVTGAGSVGFSDLKAGTYTATVTACHQTLAGMSSGAAEACSAPVTSASLTVVSKSAEPASSPRVWLGGPGGPATTAAMLAVPDRGGGVSTPSPGLDPAIRRTQWI